MGDYFRFLSGGTLDEKLSNKLLSWDVGNKNFHKISFLNRFSKEYLMYCLEQLDTV